MNRIKEVLNDKGIKQTWLSEKLGKSYNIVNGYVTNKSVSKRMINGVSIDLLTCEQDKCEHMCVRDKYTQCHFEDNHIRRRCLEYTRVDVITTVPETGNEDVF